ncbi:hypothetical protein CK203_091671 [Vitis vinifera]|uniref:Reverse transcriptase zinc-binding domain-containing protein n=1 Tax=Vitis vinifera TaxID=29760 RepID=A0A438FAY1_VITVI|nr:hypothetical protein CK203_091671 [Vitis vinifera]
MVSQMSLEDSREWSLSSSDMFSVKSFFLALSKVSNPILFLPAKFLWSSKALSKTYKSLCPQWCILCKGNGESIDHLFLHCPVTIGLWHKLFNLAGLAWVPPRSIEDMLVIAFKGLGNFLRGKTLWQIACLILLWMVWQERNNRIFEDKGRTEEMLEDLIMFFSFLWASCTATFRGVPLIFVLWEGPLILLLVSSLSLVSLLSPIGRYFIFLELFPETADIIEKGAVPSAKSSSPLVTASNGPRHALSLIPVDADDEISYKGWCFTFHLEETEFHERLVRRNFNAL